MNDRNEYKLEDEEFIELVLATYGCLPTEDSDSWVVLDDASDRCDEVWKKIAKARNLDWESVSPSPRGQEYFLAKELLRLVRS